MEVDQSDLWTSQGCKIVAGSTLIPSSEVRKHDSEVSQWNHCEADGVIELRVDDRHGCGKETTD